MLIVESFLLTSKGVLLSTTDMTGERVCDGKRKICILVCFFNIESLPGLGKVLLFGPSPVQQFLLTYKLSQHHLEWFFSAVRQFGGWNNNPSAIQFINAFRSLLSHAGVSIKSNCLSQDTTSLLNVANTD